MEIIGVGYQAIMQGKRLQLQIGYSHDIFFDLPDVDSAIKTSPSLPKASSDLENIFSNPISLVIPVIAAAESHKLIV